jgi:glycosyltransferase involved in cell wall biosynthesis
MKRKCFFISGTWSDSPVSSHLRALAEQLAQRGHQVVLIVDKQKREVVNEYGNPAVYTWPSSRPTRIRDAYFLWRLVRKYRPDCMLSMFGSTNLMLLVGWLMRVPCRVNWYLTLTEAIELDSTMARWLLKFRQWRKKLIYRFATHITPNSEAGGEDIQHVYGVPKSKCHVLYLSLADPIERLAAELSAPNQRQGAICVGRLHPTKGQDVLIRALAKLKTQIPDLICEFVGDGPCKSDCEQLVTELGLERNCRFVGRLAHDEVLRHMASSVVSVVPSRSECFGLVNLESLAVGTPVVASRVGGISEIFRDGEEGFLVPPNDPSSLAQQLAVLLQDSKLQGEMSSKARLRFHEFEQSKLISQQAHWFEEIVDHALDRSNAKASQ